MNNSPILSVIIPAYNEAQNIKRDTLAQVYRYLHAQPRSFELILVDDGSNDETLSLLNRFAQGKAEVTVIAARHRGKGPTVRQGMLQARGKYRLFTDFDQSTPITEVSLLLEAADKGYDVVIGSREIAGSIRAKEPWYRHLMGKVFNLVVRIFAVHGIHDTQCGFKLFTERATKNLFPRLTITTSPRQDAFTGAFDVELLFLARKYGFKMIEVPVHWTHIQSIRVNPIKDSIRMFWDVCRIRLSYVKGRYG